MITYNRETPILLVAFGSSETLKQIYTLFERIEPKRLYLFYDVPKSESHKNEQEQVQAIFNTIRWKCKVKTFHNKIRLEYKVTMLKAIRWFFRLEMEGIVLDGLRVPPPGLFAFCSCLLEKYRNDERIGHISCCDFLIQDKRVKTKDSYYFSRLIDVFGGWASWRRVWQDMDIQLRTYPSFKKLNIIEKTPSHKPFRHYWHDKSPLDKQWEISYEYANLINNRMSIVPDFRQISFNDYELPEIAHPVFMVTPWKEELQFQELKHHIPAITTNKPCSSIFLQEKLLSFSSEAIRRMKIPRIIHQIYEDPAGPPANLLHIAESWKEKMPGWEYRLWNRQMMKDFIETKCPDFSEYYYSYPFNVQRWDAIRYLILYHIGGLYADLDYECIRPLDVLLTGSTCCMGMEPTINSKIYRKQMVVGNALMASTSKHPYMAAIIEDMKTNFSFDYKSGDSFQIMESTGPFMVTRVYEQFNKKKSVTLLPADLATPLTIREIWMLRTGHAQQDVLSKIENAFAIHYFLGSWFEQTSEGKCFANY